MRRLVVPITGEVYHVMSKSIAGYNIFSHQRDFDRVIEMMRFYSYKTSFPRYSIFRLREGVAEYGFASYFSQQVKKEDRLVDIIAYCIMPTHVHLVVRQACDGGLSIFMGNFLNAYARYFNTRAKRLGPLWAGRYKNVHIGSDEQLLHVVRYVHLNAVTAGIVKKAADWPHSSFAEYIHPEASLYPLCDYEGLFDMLPVEHERFTNDHAGYQRELHLLKKAVLD